VDSWDATGWTIGQPLRHGSGTNGCFVDGHARWLPVGEMGRVETDGNGVYWLHYGSADR
jgi:prepilin-type processing-associated H-X9-DG protein